MRFGWTETYTLGRIGRKANLNFSPLGAAGPSRPLLPGPLGGLSWQPAAATIKNCKILVCSYIINYVSCCYADAL